MAGCFAYAPSSSCTDGEHAVGESSAWRPRDILEQDFQAAALVAHVDAKSAVVVDSIRGDDGRPGYEVWKVSGTVKETFKGHRTAGESVEYYDVAEAGLTSARLTGEHVIFLQDRDLPKLGGRGWITMENSTERYSEGLVKELRSIRAASTHTLTTTPTAPAAL
jgi:hypothetical protein